MNEAARKLLKHGTKEWNKWRNRHPRVDIDFSRENLSAVDVTGADLRRISFSHAIVSDANLSRTDLTGVTFDGAILIRTRLSHAHLENALLTNADLREAILNDAHLTRAVFSGSSIQGASLQRARLHGANLAGVGARQSILASAVITEADLSGADFADAQLRSAEVSGSSILATNFTDADLSEAKLNRSNLEDAVFSNAKLRKTGFQNSILHGADLSGADLTDANLSGADLRNVNLRHANLWRANLAGAKLADSNLSFARLVEANLEDADISGCQVYGISAWDLNLRGTRQTSLVITPPGQLTISVDNLEIAQLIYMLLNNKKIRDVIDNLAPKLILVLGRFTDARKHVLDLIRNELRGHDYLPVIFDFDKPSTRDLTETVSILAHIAKFVIADITDAKSIPQELGRIVPNLPSVPIQPIICSSDKEYGMFEHFARYPWVLDIHRYDSPEDLLSSLSEKILKPIEMKLLELGPPKLGSESIW